MIAPIGCTEGWDDREKVLACTNKLPMALMPLVHAHEVTALLRLSGDARQCEGDSCY
jgi:hypothetical protein